MNVSKEALTTKKLIEVYKHLLLGFTETTFKKYLAAHFNPKRKTVLCPCVANCFYGMQPLQNNVTNNHKTGWPYVYAYVPASKALLRNNSRS